jgi:hypothetical protein
MKSRFHLVCAHWLAGLGIMVLLLNGCTVAQQSNGVHIQGDASRLSFNTPELMCKAILVADAGIAGLGPGHWNTPDGTRPATADARTLVRGGYMIYTPLRFSYMHTHVDRRSQPTREFDSIGGQVGPDSDSEGYPQVMPQHSYLLVLVYGIQALQGESQAVMVVTDAFPIDAQGVVTLQPAHTEGKGQETESFPAVTMPLSQIVQQLANCK